MKLKKCNCCSSQLTTKNSKKLSRHKKDGLDFMFLKCICGNIFVYTGKKEPYHRALTHELKKV